MQPGLQFLRHFFFGRRFELRHFFCRLGNCDIGSGSGNTNSGSTGSGADVKKGVQSSKTGDAGVALYAAMSLLSLTGGAVVLGRKRKAD